ncbi:hypothetical protein J6590_032448 [Homalodisca vitripennis]|nr:hypothetical protein J6590_032448 [Homalodisca vitripennis]
MFLMINHMTAQAASPITPTYPQQQTPNPHPKVCMVFNTSDIIGVSVPKAASLNSKGPIKNC